MYPMAEPDLRDLQKYIDEMLEAGFIRESSSPIAAPILYVPKSDGSRRLCVDYCALNAIVEPDCYPVPLVADLVDLLRGSKIF
jgi:hypothetical protein